jgi:hypothetical protein
MYHSLEQLTERLNQQINNAVIVNPVKVDFFNGHIEIYNIKSESLDVEVCVFNNKIQISGTYGTYVFGDFSNPLYAFRRLSSIETDPNVFLNYLLAHDTTRGSVVFDIRLAISELSEYVYEAIRDKIEDLFHGVRDNVKSEILYDSHEDFMESISDFLFMNSDAIKSNEDFINTIQSEKWNFHFIDVMSESALEDFDVIPILNGKDMIFNLPVDNFEWLDADVVSYHFIMSVFIISWLSKEILD